MKRIFYAVAVAVALAGCSKSPEALSAARAKLFDSADAESKALWATVMSATKTNGYIESLVALQSLRQKENLTPPQDEAVYDTMAAVNTQLRERAEKGDPAAKKVLADMNQMQRR